jgi:hypothetical protein
MAPGEGAEARKQAHVRHSIQIGRMPHRYMYTILSRPRGAINITIIKRLKEDPEHTDDDFDLVWLLSTTAPIERCPARLVADTSNDGFPLLASWACRVVEGFVRGDGQG